MIDEKDVEKLAKLSRIAIPEDSKRTLIKDLEAVLGYVSEVQSATGGDVEHIAGEIRNVMREDGQPHEPAFFTKEIIDSAPDSKDSYIKVKKIL